MVSGEENETLTRVGPGTAMGDLMRQYWLPALLSAELADGVPLRVRLLGEDLVAFRSGSLVGLLAEACPHRRASLYYGRVEADGLRCAYHGWKFDSAGPLYRHAERASGLPLRRQGPYDFLSLP